MTIVVTLYKLIIKVLKLTRAKLLKFTKKMNNYAYKIVPSLMWCHFRSRVNVSNYKVEVMFYGCQEDFARKSIAMSCSKELESSISRICKPGVDYNIMVIDLNKCLNIQWKKNLGVYYPHSLTPLRMFEDIVGITKLKL